MQYELLSAEPRYPRGTFGQARNTASVRDAALPSRGMALSACPSCDSEFLQPMRCEPKDADEVLVELRCPDCMTHLHAAFSRADMAELDRRQSAWRDEIVAAYERSVQREHGGARRLPGPGARSQT